jgi:hypothetical protein
MKRIANMGIMDKASIENIISTLDLFSFIEICHIGRSGISPASGDITNLNFSEPDNNI